VAVATLMSIGIARANPCCLRTFGLWIRSFKKMCPLGHKTQRRGTTIRPSPYLGPNALVL